MGGKGREKGNDEVFLWKEDTAPSPPIPSYCKGLEGKGSNLQALSNSIENTML